MRAIERICLYLVVGYAAVSILDGARADEDAKKEKAKPVAEAPPSMTLSDLTVSSLSVKGPDGNVVMRLSASQSGGGKIDLFTRSGKLATRLYVRKDHDGELQLRDENGALRANMGGNDDGGYANFYNGKGTMAAYLGSDGAQAAGYIALYGAEDKKALEMMANAHGGLLSARNTKTDQRVAALGVAAETGAGLLAAGSADGKPGVALFSSTHGGQIIAFNAASKKAAFLGVSANPAGNGLLYVSQKNGNRIFETGATTNGGGYLSVRNGENRRVAFLGASSGDAPHDGVLELETKSGKLGVVLRAYQGGSSVRVYDKNGKVLRNIR